MRNIQDFSDRRHKAWCIHCTEPLFNLETNRDHVPTKGLLREPYPPNLPVIEICKACNLSFSADEEYFIALLGAVLTGSTDPTVQKHPSAARIP